MKLLLIATAAAALFLSGCAVNKDWAATGGSRSDGVVRLSYEVAEMEQPQLNEQQAIRLASQRHSAARRGATMTQRLLVVSRGNATGAVVLGVARSIG